MSNRVSLATHKSPQKTAGSQISEWNSRVRAEDGPRTSNPRGQLDFESRLDDEEAPPSLEFKEKAPGVTSGRSLQRETEDIRNFFRPANRQGGDTGSDQEGLSAGGDMRGSREEGSGGTGGVEDEGEGCHCLGREGLSYLTGSEI